MEHLEALADVLETTAAGTAAAPALERLEFAFVWRGGLGPHVRPQVFERLAAAVRRALAFLVGAGPGDITEPHMLRTNVHGPAGRGRGAHTPCSRAPPSGVEMAPSWLAAWHRVPEVGEKRGDGQG